MENQEKYQANPVGECAKMTEAVADWRERDVNNQEDKSIFQSSTASTRSYNVGNSNYSNMPEGYQPWDLWKIFHMNPWDADIQKRLLRTKAEPGMTMAESRKLDYEKIIHNCLERIAQINEGYEF